MTRLTFEDFSTPAPEPAAPAAPPAREPALPDAQEIRLNAYEEGYKAGWDDATAAENEARTRIGADFAKTLQELSFSYHEARSHVLGALGPLLSAIVEKVVPQVAESGFARTVLEVAMQMAEKAGDAPVEIRVCPENRPALAELTGTDPGLPLRIVEDDTLGPGQALLSGATGECEIDIDGMLDSIRAALDEFLTTEEEARRHG